MRVRRAINSIASKWQIEPRTLKHCMISRYPAGLKSAGDGPQSIAAVLTQGVKDISLDQLGQGGAGQAYPSLDILRHSLSVAACRDNLFSFLIFKVLDLAEVEPESEVADVVTLQTMVEEESVNAHRSHLHAMLHRIAYQLRRSVRAHKLGVGQCSDEEIGKISRTFRNNMKGLSLFHTMASQYKLKHSKNGDLVPWRRLELPRPCGHRYLKPARLPIPPPGLGTRCRNTSLAVLACQPPTVFGLGAPRYALV